MQPQAQRDITSYEILAQHALLMLVAILLPAGRLALHLPTLSDNTGSESSVNKLFSTAYPVCMFLRRIASLSALSDSQGSFLRWLTSQVRLTRTPTFCHAGMGHHNLNPDGKCSIALACLWSACGISEQMLGCGLRTPPCFGNRLSLDSSVNVSASSCQQVPRNAVWPYFEQPIGQYRRRCAVAGFPRLWRCAVAGFPRQ